MRLPTDATLLIGANADPQLERVWREERLPVAPLDAELEALDTATLIVAGDGAGETAARAARLGFRTFLIGDTESADIRSVTTAQAIDSARVARARERWKAARAADGAGSRER